MNPLKKNIDEMIFKIFYKLEDYCKNFKNPNFLRFMFFTKQLKRKIENIKINMYFKFQKFQNCIKFLVNINENRKNRYIHTVTFH